MQRVFRSVAVGPLPHRAAGHCDGTGAVGPASKKHWEFDPFSKEKCMTPLNFLKSVSIQIVSAKADGASSILHTILLTNARIVNVARYSATGSGAGRAQEELTLTYDDASVNGACDPSFPQMLARLFPAGRA
jgi:hypothetical protein